MHEIAGLYIAVGLMDMNVMWILICVSVASSAEIIGAIDGDTLRCSDSDNVGFWDDIFEDDVVGYLEGDNVAYIVGICDGKIVLIVGPLDDVSVGCCDNIEFIIADLCPTAHLYCSILLLDVVSYNVEFDVNNSCYCI